MEERFVLGEITKDLFEKYSQKIKQELAEINTQITSYSFGSSNLKTAVEKTMVIAENISQLWVSASYEDKQHLQKLIFPEGAVYSKPKHEVRTGRVNNLFASIPMLASVSAENKKGDSIKNRQKFSSVLRTWNEAISCHEERML